MELHLKHGGSLFFLRETWDLTSSLNMQRSDEIQTRDTMPSGWWFQICLFSIVYPIGSMYGIYANIWGMLMVNVTIYSIHGSYGLGNMMEI